MTSLKYVPLRTHIDEEQHMIFATFYGKKNGLSDIVL